MMRKYQVRFGGGRLETCIRPSAPSRDRAKVGKAPAAYPTMRRTEVTYGQLDKVLRSFGFTCHPGTNDPPGRIYQHKKAGAVIMLPAFPESDKVYEHHLVAARVELDNFGIADPKTFDAKLQKAG